MPDRETDKRGTQTSQCGSWEELDFSLQDLPMFTIYMILLGNARVIDLRTLNSDSDSKPLSDDSDSNHDS